MKSLYERQYVSRLVPKNGLFILTFIIATSVVDSVLLGYDSAVIGSMNVMPEYYNYFQLTTTTEALNTSISSVGGCVASLFSGFLVDWRGRRESIFWSALIPLVGAIIQTAAQNFGMFIAGRFIIGLGMGFASTATPIYVAETTPPNHRAFALGVYYSCWSVGTMMASGICYGSQSVPSTWAWRIPSLIQIVPSLLCMLIILFIPESPRWLVHKDRHAEALEVLAVVNSGGDKTDSIVLLQYHEISDTIAYEKGPGRQLSLVQACKTPANRKRLIIAVSFACIVMLPGTNIVTFYFGTMLSQAGITSATTQLQINVILTAWSFVIAMVCSWYADKISRKWLCSLSLGGGIICFYLLGGLTYAYGSGTDTAGIYGTIACIFLYNGTYSFGITPLTVLYPPEILSYQIRATGMAMYTFLSNACGLFVTMALPYALDAIGWKTYMVNASFDVLMLAFVIVYWVETKGLTLEEVDKKFDGIKHSEVPDLEQVIVGEKGLVIEGVSVEEAPVSVIDKKADLK